MVEIELSGHDSKNVCRNSRIMMCSDKEFFIEKKKTYLCLALMERQVLESGKVSTLPLEIQPFLNEFKEIIKYYLSVGLPPLRSISHQIDLILESNLLNKYLACLTPIDSEEVNR
jgi:hypothetical protein